MTLVVKVRRLAKRVRCETVAIPAAQASAFASRCQEWMEWWESGQRWVRGGEGHHACLIGQQRSVLGARESQFIRGCRGDSSTDELPKRTKSSVNGSLASVNRGAAGTKRVLDG